MTIWLRRLWCLAWHDSPMLAVSGMWRCRTCQVTHPVVWEKEIWVRREEENAAENSGSVPERL
jgi:hypothetical protein